MPFFADGAAETAVLDAEHGLMTIGGVEYQKYPSELSGKTGLTVLGGSVATPGGGASQLVQES